ncbi:ParB N-terminal domain-containing protein [Clostridium perfringens]|uniref:ParB/RepB/Spo0J family partition protein n=2 Tax=Clostridium perfringens TaxID=1502 RepID=UPI0018E40646|nr:ParB N-terminal domain-containing protein [Clostridium perfringens]MBI6006851.1 ParB N-terminal domain-containing protein [Clostridium perfringens]
MQNIKVSELKKHPRNEEFFDDIYGEKWESFIESVKRRGIVEPIVVTQDLMIVSGHQRVRACEEIGILEIPCRITHYPDYDERYNRTKDDMILEDLISTNIMQRGVGNVNPMKMARCVQELERIKGVRQGSAGGVGVNQYNKVLQQDNLTQAYSQKDMAEELGITRQQLQDYKKLLNLIPELQQMVENGSMKATVGYKIWARMSIEEQEKLFNDIGREKIKTLTQKATKEYIDKINSLEKDLENEKRKEPKTIVKEKIIDNTDYEGINKLKNEKRQAELELLKLKDKLTNPQVIYKNNPELESEVDRLKNIVKDKEKQLNDYHKVRIELAEKQKMVAQFTGENTNLELISTTSEGKAKMMEFLEEMAKYDYLAESFNEIPIASRNEWIKAVKGVQKWANSILDTVVLDDYNDSNINNNNYIEDVHFTEI